MRQVSDYLRPQKCLYFSEKSHVPIHTLDAAGAGAEKNCFDSKTLTEILSRQVKGN
jgi:hypothetical protein